MYCTYWLISLWFVLDLYHPARSSCTLLTTTCDVRYRGMRPSASTSWKTYDVLAALCDMSSSLQLVCSNTPKLALEAALFRENYKSTKKRRRPYNSPHRRHHNKRCLSVRLFSRERERRSFRARMSQFKNNNWSSAGLIISLIPAINH